MLLAVLLPWSYVATCGLMLLLAPDSCNHTRLRMPWQPLLQLYLLPCCGLPGDQARYLPEVGDGKDGCSTHGK